MASSFLRVFCVTCPSLSGSGPTTIILFGFDGYHGRTLRPPRMACIRREILRACLPARKIIPFGARSMNVFGMMFLVLRVRQLKKTSVTLLQTYPLDRTFPVFVTNVVMLTTMPTTAPTTTSFFAGAPWLPPASALSSIMGNVRTAPVSGLISALCVSRSTAKLPTTLPKLITKDFLPASSVPEKIKTPLKPEVFAFYLRSRLDQQFVKKVLRSLTENASLGYTGPHNVRITPNPKSARVHSVFKEIGLSHTVGPFATLPFLNMVVHPFQ